MSAFITHNIDEALATWKRGGLVAMPTETVYGLAAPVDQKELVEKIFAFKERPFFDPLIVHVASIEDAKTCARHWPKLADELATRFWPGPLTMVLKKSEQIDPLITSGLDTVGLRMPQHQVAIELIKAIGKPLAAPSANKFTKTSPTSEDHVLENFKKEDVCILSSPPSEGGIESTIVRIDEEKQILEILRPGLITSDELKEVAELFHYKLLRGKSAFDKAIEAPGQFHVHYKPDHPLVVLEEEQPVPENFERVTLNVDPYVSARELYALMQAPLKSGKTGRAIILSKKRKSLTGKELSLWSSIENRLDKAASKS